MSYSASLAAQRRLVILKLMIEDGGQANDGSLVTAFRELGHYVGLDTASVRKMMEDLAERNCITIEIVRDVVMLGRITERGRMTAAGYVSVDGVASAHQGL